MATKTIQKKTKQIVIYFARKKLFEDIAKNKACNFNADLYEIQPTVDLKGKGSFFTAWEYYREKKLVPIANPTIDLDSYEEYYFVCPLNFDRINLPTLSLLVYLKPKLKNVHYVIVGNDKRFDRTNVEILNNAANIKEPKTITYIRCNKSYKKIKEELIIK